MSKAIPRRAAAVAGPVAAAPDGPRGAHRAVA